MAVQKQFIVGIKENHFLYGYRGFQPNDGDFSGNSETGEISCTVKDAEDFIASATDPIAYMATTCWYVWSHWLKIIFLFFLRQLPAHNFIFIFLLQLGSSSK